MSSLSLLISFGLKSILPDIKMATLAWFLGPFARNVFFHCFTLSLMLRCVSWMQQKDGSSFHIYFVSLCLFILFEELKPLLQRDINERVHRFLLFCCGMHVCTLMRFLLLICCSGIIYSVFSWVWLNSLRLDFSCSTFCRAFRDGFVDRYCLNFVFSIYWDCKFCSV